MKKTLIYFLLTIMLGMLLIVSCDDDDTLIINEGPDYFILGEVLMRPYIEVIGNIHPINGQELEIDSIKFADSLCTIRKSSAFVDGTNYNYSFFYRNQADSLRFTSGSVAEIVFYSAEETISTFVKLLRVPDDTVVIVSPENESNFAVNEAVPLVWNDVPHADWYSVTYIFDTSYLFGSQVTYHYEATTDTTFTIPQTDHITDGSYLIYITSITGSNPTGGNSLNGNTMVGTIFGSATPGVRYGHQVIIGAGPAEGVGEATQPKENRVPSLLERFSKNYSF